MSSFSVIIPALNEKNNIYKLIPKIYDVVQKSSHNFEVIFIIGKDETIITNNNYINLFFINRDKQYFSSTLVQGINFSQYEFIITMDSDGSHNFQEIDKYLDYFINKDLDILLFSRYLKSSRNNESIINVLLSKLLNKILNIYSELKLTDYTNNLRVFKKSLIRTTPYISRHFEFLYEFLILAKKDFPQLTIEEVPTVHLKRKLGRSKKHHIYYLFNFFQLILRVRISKL